MKNLIPLILLMALSACSQEQTKPNLLFLWTDEQQYFTMKAYGNDVIQTPNLDRLAEASFVFEKAYVTQPVCSPDRASVMTGLYPHTHGITTNNIPLDPSIKTLPEIIDDPEYHTAYMGKWHLGNEIFQQRGYDTWVSIEDNYIRYYSPDKDRNARSEYHHWLVEKGYEPDEDNRFSRSYAARLPFEHCKPKFLEEKAIAFLEEHGDRPFMLYINFLEPHMPFFGPLDSLYDPAEVILPANFHDVPDENDPLSHHRKWEGNKRQYGYTEQEIRELIARYWGLNTQVDISVGAVLDKLESLGLDANTIVVYTSDHGDMMGAHGMVTKGVMYEESARIPFMLMDPRMEAAPRKISAPVSQVDIVPTLLELMDHELPGYLQGESLVPVLTDKASPGRDVFIEWNENLDYRVRDWEDREPTAEDLKTGNPSIRTIVSQEGYKLSLGNRDKSQLFDLNKDPLEINNLFYEDEYQDLVRELSGRIRDWQLRMGDTLSLPVI